MLNLRSSKDPNGGDSVEVVAAHEVGDVILDLHLFTGETSSLEHLRSGRIVVLKIRHTQLITANCVTPSYI